MLVSALSCWVWPLRWSCSTLWAGREEEEVDGVQVEGEEAQQRR